MTKPPLSNRTVFLLLLGASLAVAMLPVLWPQLDLAVTAYFLQPAPAFNPATWPLVALLNDHLPTLFRTLTVLCLTGWLLATLRPRWRHRALALTFLGFSLLLGPGLATWAMKEHHQRARPAHVVEFGGDRQFTRALVPADQCQHNCAFTSGHAACGFFLVSLMLLDPRRRWLWIGAGVATGTLVALARLSVGAHWLSDTLWALPVTLLASGLVWALAARVYPPAPLPLPR